MTLLSTNRAHRQATSRGFTLVELMVVFTLYAIVMGLLLPALASAKEKSRRTVCKSNMRQFWSACYVYGMDNSEMLPPGSDNHGASRTISLSDTTYASLSSYLGGKISLMECPNIVFGCQTNYDINYGHLIGYNYLVQLNIATASRTTKIVTAAWTPPMTIIDDPTNVLLADANYWSPTTTGFKVAPHTSRGGAILNGTSFMTGLKSTNSADIGAEGGNIARMDGSVTWRSIHTLGMHQASDDQSYGAW